MSSITGQVKYFSMPGVGCEAVAMYLKRIPQLNDKGIAPCTRVATGKTGHQFSSLVNWRTSGHQQRLFSNRQVVSQKQGLYGCWKRNQCPQCLLQVCPKNLGGAGRRNGSCEHEMGIGYERFCPSMLSHGQIGKRTESKKVHELLNQRPQAWFTHPFESDFGSQNGEPQTRTVPLRFLLKPTSYVSHS